MVRFIFLFVVFIHGFIHLFGFAKAFNVVTVPQLSGKTLVPLSRTWLRFAGLVWRITFLLFLSAGILFLLKNETWWNYGLPAVILSQLLILLYWKDAKAGTLVNCMILPAIVVSMAELNFNTVTKNETLELLKSQVTQPAEVISEESIQQLPFPVRNWLSHSGMIGKNRISNVRLQQNGFMLTKPGGKWTQAEANQYFTVDRPGFIWKVKMRMPPCIEIDGRDKLILGKGSMIIKVFSLYSIVNSKGEEIDQGSMLRYLAETVWFPSAALSDYMSWEPIDSLSAKATLTDSGKSYTGIFTFDKAGNVTAFEAERYGEFEGKYSLEKWRITCTDHREFSGIIIPTKSEVTWKLKEGDFTWFKIEIKNIEYNTKELYPD